MATGDKRKLTTPLAYPATLDMAPYVEPLPGAAPAAPDDLLFDLEAVLVHRGPSAHSGHYVAHVRHAAAGAWAELDDDVCTARVPDAATGALPVGEPSYNPYATAGAGSAWRSRGRWTRDGGGGVLTRPALLFWSESREKGQGRQGRARGLAGHVCLKQRVCAVVPPPLHPCVPRRRGVGAALRFLL